MGTRLHAHTNAAIYDDRAWAAHVPAYMASAGEDYTGLVHLRVFCLPSIVVSTRRFALLT